MPCAVLEEQSRDNTVRHRLSSPHAIHGIVERVNDNARVGQRVATLRKVRGLTQQRLAAAVHFSTSLVKQVEQGSTRPAPRLSPRLLALSV